MRRVVSIEVEGVTVRPSAPRSTRWRRPSAVATRKKSAAAASMTRTFSPSSTMPSPSARGSIVKPPIVAAAERERDAGDRVGEERRGSERVAHLLEEDGELDDAEALATPLLRQGEAGPAELRHLLPVGLLE